MTKRDDLGLETLFCTNSCSLLKTVKNWCTQCENDKTCWSRAENAVLYKLLHFAENNQFSAPEQHVVSFSHWAHHFLAIFSKVHEFVQNSDFSPISARLCHFCSERTTFQRFPPKCTGLFKTAFSARHQKVLRFLHFAHHFLAIFRKVHKIVQINVFSPRYTRFVIFALGALLLSHFQVRGFVRKSVLGPRSEPFVIFAQGTPLLDGFRQSGRVFTKERFPP